MAQIKRRGNILWIKYYDKLERKHKEFSTKERDTVRGWNEARKMLKEFSKHDEFGEKFVELTKTKTFSEGYAEFLEVKVLKKKTKEVYGLVKRHFLGAVEDKDIAEYTIWDYKKFLKYLDEKTYTRQVKKEEKEKVKGTKLEKNSTPPKNLSNNTKAIYTTHLNTLFNYFVKRKYLKENFVEPIRRKIKKPELINEEDLKVILSELELKENKSQYYFIMFLLITGFRRSTAIDLKWKEVDFGEKVIRANNVKRGREFLFPITKELELLLREIQASSKNLYNVFDFTNNGLKFYWRLQAKLFTEKRIARKYTMHQLRKTFITRLLEEGIPLHNVKELADHSNISTTLNYYTAINVGKMREAMESVKIIKNPALLSSGTISGTVPK